MKILNYITPKGFKSLTDEQDNLLKIERPKITELVTWAASLGDRSENADYIYGKRRLREIDRRLRFLAQRIDAAKIVDPISIKSERIQFGATVVIENEEGKAKKYSIVGVDEINTDKGYISWQSPIAKALIGKTVGDQITIHVPQGEYIIEVTSISYTELL